MQGRRCADCGQPTSERARFCERCGVALTAGAEPLRAPHALEDRILQERSGIEGEHKQVTVMYADIVGSMALTHALAAERWGFVLDRFLAIAAAAVHEFEGTVNQFTGDGLLAVFGAPLAHEDHARRACLAALELQRRTAELAADVAQRDGAEFSVRCGLNSGEVVVGAIGDDVHMDFVPIGNTTALGKRIESLAPAGSIAISASTAALVVGEFELRELGEFDVKGAEGRQRILELLGPGPAQTRLAAHAATRGLSRFVGREAERGALQAALEHAMAGDGRAVGIVGDPGVGKSRLVHEFAGDCAARGVAVSSTAAVAHGRYIPFLPMLALYRDYFAIAERDTPEVARERIENTMLALDESFAGRLPLLFEFLGVADPQRPLAPVEPGARQDLLLALAAQIVQARSRHEPAVLVVEDLQWLDAASASVFETLVKAAAGTPTLVIGTYRPEYAAAWARNAPHAQLEITPLDDDATDDLLAELLGRHRQLGGLQETIKARTAGNPFFIEEIVQTLAESGRQLTEPGDGALPPTVQAGLAARIDRLPGRAKALVQTMAVIGSEIPGSLLSAVSDLDATELAETVELLARAQMVVARDLPGEYAFKHPLTQEVAYGSQLSDPRGRAHERVAAAIQRTYPGGLDERAALLAHHYEAAGDGLRAADWHVRAAEWAEITAPGSAMGHWRRVRHLTGALDASPASDELAAKARDGILKLGWRLGVAPDEMAELHAEAQADATGSPAELHYAGARMHGAREREGLDRFKAAHRALTAVGDPGQVLTVATGVAYSSWIAGSLPEALAALDQGLALAGDDPTVGSGWAFICPMAGALADRGHCRGYAGELEQAYEDLGRAIDLARAYDDQETLSAAHAKFAQLQVEIGDHAAALENANAGLRIAEASGNVIHTIACAVPAAMAHARAGHFIYARAAAQSNLTAIRERGIGLYYEPALLSTVARCELGLGEPSLALTTADEAVAIAEDRGLTTCALSARIALAEILAATPGDEAADRVQAVLDRAMFVARQSGATAFEPLLFTPARPANSNA